MQVFERLEHSDPKHLVRAGTILFSASIALAYALYPHWVTFSDFVGHWYTLLPFVFAMLIAIAELWYIGFALHRQPHLRGGSYALYASAACAMLIVCIPYAGTATQKDIHKLVALLFALFAAIGFVMVAKRTRSLLLATLGFAVFGLCVLELIFLVRYKTHPVYPWVWSVLELGGTASLIAALYTTAKILEKLRDSNQFG